MIHEIVVYRVLCIDIMGFPTSKLGGGAPAPPNFWKIIFNGVSPPPQILGCP